MRVSLNIFIDDLVRLCKIKQQFGYIKSSIKFVVVAKFFLTFETIKIDIVGLNFLLYIKIFKLSFY